MGKARWKGLKDEELFNNVITNLLQRSGSNVHVKVEATFRDKRLVGGKYHMATDTVFLYMEPIKQQCSLLFGSLEPLETYIMIVLAHELGHALDPDLGRLSGQLDSLLTEREVAETRLRIEENAWDYALSILLDIDPVMMQLIMDESLES